MICQHEQESHPDSAKLQTLTPQGITSSNDSSKTIREEEKELYDEGNGGGTVHEDPTSAAATQQRWNHPRKNMWRTYVCFLMLFSMGLNDGAVGALIPYLQPYYHLSYTIVSLVFLAPGVGCTTAALLNSRIHMVFGQRGIAFVAPGARFVAYIINSQHPPFPVLVISMILAGFGVGLEDGAWNAWLGDMQNANEVLGLLHGFYGLGATLSPLIITSMIVKARLEWYVVYYLLVGMAAIELGIAMWAFWEQTGLKYREANPRTIGKTGGRTREALRTKVTWICSLFLFVYVGVEIAVGGWVVVYMREVKHASPFAAGMSETGFWLGATVGRVILGFVTPRIGEKLAIIIYLCIAIGCHLVFWLVPIVILSAVAVALEGFFIGPMFPAAVLAATKLLPRDLHVGAIGFIAAFGAVGGTLFPFIVGAITQVKGAQVLMPIVLSMLVADEGIWLLLPGLKSL